MVKELPQIVNRINTAIPLPSLPQLLFKLIDVCRNPSCSVEDISRIVLLDPAITVKLMRLSAHWMPGFTGVQSIEKVISLLGANNMRKLALVALATPITNNAMRRSAVKLSQFWRHSILCALLARKLAERQGDGSPGNAYLAGLLHDIGQLLLWTHFRKAFDPIFPDPTTAAAAAEQEKSRIGTDHCEAGWRLAREARLQPMIADAILYHHRPAPQIAHAMPLVRLAYAARILSHRQQDPFSLAEVMQSIGLQQTPTQIEKLVAEAGRGLETVSRYLGIRPEAVTGAEPNASSENFLPIYEFLREFRELSLVQIAAGEIDAENGRDTAQRELRLTLQILFDILPVCFFYYDPVRNILTGKSTAGCSGDILIDGLEVPVKPGTSLAGAAVINNQIVDSFGYLAGEISSIADEQLLRLLGTEGMVCLPLERRGKLVGVIVGGINESQFPVLSEQISLLTQFADRAARVLEDKSEFGRDRHLFSPESVMARDAVRRVIHEVNNPLGIIKNYLDILGPKVRDLGQGQEEIDLIREEIDRIPGIIHQLTATQSSTGAAAEIIDINHILFDLSKLLKPSVLEPANISLHFAPDPQLPSFTGSRGNLVQVFTNILKNAIEAMPEGGNIFIQTAHQQRSAGNGPGRILIEIRDDGPGIPESVMHHLFDPGYSSKGPENFGLGLSISREILQRYNGDIQCQTRANEGTTFRIVLPCSSDEGRDEKEKSV